ncbi:MAG: YcjF family protein [Beijerinckiaceae bacterium]
MSEQKPRPQAFRLDDRRIVVDRAGAAQQAAFTIEPESDFFAAEAAAQGMDPSEQAIEVAQSRGIVRRAIFSWPMLFWSAATGFVVVAVGTWFVSLIENFFAHSPLLGTFALALAGLAALAILVLLGREISGILRQSRIAHLHMAFAAARVEDDRDAARQLVTRLVAIHADRPQSAQVRAHLQSLTHEIIDAPDLIDIAEAELIGPLDTAARHEIAAAAKRVSMVTAIAPRAFIDIAFVAAQAIRLIRRIAEIYGGRPGLLGFLRLARSVGAHLAITGGMAVGDSLIQQVVGHGLAARLSARLGEGVLNGLLTARIGVSTMAVCRPMPFVTGKPPNMREVAPFLFRKEEKG